VLVIGRSSGIVICAMLAILLVGVARGFTQAAAPDTPSPRTIRVNDADLACVEQGQGEPVVLIHGFLHDYRVWSAQLAEVSRHYRVLACSMRYRWPNTPPQSGLDLSPGVDLADAIAVIQALELGRVHLVGHSSGANLALRLARDRPGLVRSLVLGEPAMPALVAGHPEVRPLFTPALMRSIREAYERGDAGTALQLVAAGVLGNDGSPPPLEPWVGRMLLDNAWQIPQLWSGGEPEPPFTCEDARRIEVPALLLGGDRSPAFFRVSLDELRKCLPESERAVLPESSHGLEVENPAAFNRIVLEFLARHRGKDGPSRP
jgi:pimeloyl-ACP methyl ester carboxylesterase